MVTYINSRKMGRGKHGWLDSYFHFSFAEYYNPDNIQFGVLRVLNDDTVQPGTGFDTHPHKNMEIISYVVAGQLTHADSMDNRRTLTRGQVQYMSAGTGVLHSEHNMSQEDPLRFLQVWILPDRDGYTPAYGDHAFAWEERSDKWLHIATGDSSSDAPIHIHADANVYAAEIAEGTSLQFPMKEDRQAYLTLVEGKADAEGKTMSARDSMEIVGQPFTVKATGTAHVFVVEMHQS